MSVTRSWRPRRTGAGRRAFTLGMIGAIGLMVVGSVPAMAAGSGTVDGHVTITRAAACLEISTTSVDFGTLSLGADNAPGTPDIVVSNCGDGLEDLLASGTNATGGATWTLVDSAETCADTLGLNNYHLRLATTAGAPIATLSTANKTVGTLSQNGSATHSPRISTACPGSSGSGATLNMQINYLVTNTELVLEDLPVVTQATAEEIANFVVDAQGGVAVPANCASTPAIGCVNGVPSNPAGTLEVTGHSLVSTPAGPDAWDAVAHAGVVTQAPIPFSYQGFNCTLAGNTALGANSDLTITAHLAFKSFPNPNGPKNYLEVSNANVSGLDTADLSIGGDSLCSLASIVLPNIVSQLQSNLAAALNQNVCGDPNSNGYIVCPPLQ